MKLSTRSRYGLRLLFELALNYKNNSYMLLKDIGENQAISEKYLSNIIIPLKASKMVVSARGAHGGYSLGRDPSEITVREVVDILEGNSIVVECLQNTDACDRINNCPTQGMWRKFEEHINNFLSSVTLKNLLDDYYSKIKGNEAMYYI